MQIHAHDAASGREFSGVAEGLDEATISGFFNRFDVSDEGLRRWIGGLPFSADAKAILYNISTTTIRATFRAGEYVIKIGRKILEVIYFLVRKFPRATFWTIIGGVLGWLATSIPIIGFMIGPLVMALGVAKGVYEEIKDAAMKQAMRESMAGFEALRTS